ncbi:MAG: DUF4430 domain-containing protein [Ruminococcaceae bacterium]|nr:DUF4430 domain-containing protein [Oscillospiraceae bacterium]
MKNNSMRKLLSLVLVFVLIAALALTGCSGKPAETTAPPEQPAEQATVLGEGSKSFNLTIVDKEGNEHLYEIHTDEEMVGYALIAHELIEGEEGPYGMYIKSVLGQVLDYDTDGMYWSFYVGSEYAMTGVDQTPITEGEHYQLKAEAA